MLLSFDLIEKRDALSKSLSGEMNVNSPAYYTLPRRLQGKEPLTWVPAPANI